jgi:hypothetical protein
MLFFLIYECEKFRRQSYCTRLINQVIKQKILLLKYCIRATCLFLINIHEKFRLHTYCIQLINYTQFLHYENMFWPIGHLETILHCYLTIISSYIDQCLQIWVYMYDTVLLLLIWRSSPFWALASSLWGSVFLHSLDEWSARRKAATYTGQHEHRINAEKHPCL